MHVLKGDDMILQQGRVLLMYPSPVTPDGIDYTAPASVENVHKHAISIASGLALRSILLPTGTELSDRLHEASNNTPPIFRHIFTFCFLSSTMDSFPCCPE